MKRAFFIALTLVASSAAPVSLGDNSNGSTSSIVSSTNGTGVSITGPSAHHLLILSDDWSQTLHTTSFLLMYAIVGLVACCCCCLLPVISDEDRFVVLLLPALIFFFFAFLGAVAEYGMFIPWLTHKINSGLLDRLDELGGHYIVWQTHLFVGGGLPVITLLGFLVYLLTIACRDASVSGILNSSADEVKGFTESLLENVISGSMLFLRCGIAILFLAFFQIDFSGSFLALVIFAVSAGVLDFLKFWYSNCFEGDGDGLKQYGEVLQDQTQREHGVECSGSDEERGQIGTLRMLPVKPPNVYGSLKHTMTGSVLTFSVQSSLAVFYLLGILEGGAPDFTAWKTFLYFYFGVLVQLLIVYRQSEVNNANLRSESVYWKFLFAANSLYKKQKRIDNGEYQILYEHQNLKGGAFTKKEQVATDPSLWTLVPRIFMSFLINIIVRAIVVWSLPIMLCTSESYMDFVLNAAATIFIIELDDMDEDYDVSLRKLTPDERHFRENQKKLSDFEFSLRWLMEDDTTLKRELSGQLKVVQAFIHHEIPKLKNSDHEELEKKRKKVCKEIAQISSQHPKNTRTNDWANKHLAEKPSVRKQSRSARRAMTVAPAPLEQEHTAPLELPSDSASSLPIRNDRQPGGTSLPGEQLHVRDVSDSAISIQDGSNPASKPNPV